MVRLLGCRIQTQGSLLCWQRAMLANRLAKTGKEWTDIFAQHNSGTYNNQVCVSLLLSTDQQPVH